MKLQMATLTFRGWTFEFKRTSKKRILFQNTKATKPLWYVAVKYRKATYNMACVAWVPSAALCRRIKKHIRTQGIDAVMLQD